SGRLQIAIPAMVPRPRSRVLDRRHDIDDAHRARAGAAVRSMGGGVRAPKENSAVAAERCWIVCTDTGALSRARAPVRWGTPRAIAGKIGVHLARRPSSVKEGYINTGLCRSDPATPDELAPQ